MDNFPQWYSGLVSWLSATRINELFGFVGFFITILGFPVTLYGVYRSKKAAEAAKDAAEQTRDRIDTFYVIRVLSSAIAQIRALQSEQREGNYRNLPVRYNEIRALLIGVRERAMNLSDEQRTVIQSTISLLSRIEQEVERALAAGKPWGNVAKANGLLSERTDELLAPLHTLERTATEDGHG